MTEVTMDTQFGAAAAPADAVLEILVVMDAKYDDPEYMAAMDASSASLAHQAGTAAAVWAGTESPRFSWRPVSVSQAGMA